MTSRPSILRHVAASIVSALAVSGAVLAAVTLLFFTAGELSQTPPSFWSIGWVFLPSSLVLVVLLAVVALLRAYIRWYWTLLLALISAAIAAVLGTTISFLSQGVTLSGAAWAAIFSTLWGENLPFVVLSIVLTLAIAVRAYRWMIARTSIVGAEVHGLALVRSPASTLAQGELTHVTRTPVELEVAEAQWDGYVAALEAEGFATLEIESSDEHPDSVFIEDTVVMLGQTAVIGSPGAESRRGEPDAVAAALADLGLDARQIRLPGTLDGGDVLKIGSTVYVGRGGRTNAEGIRQFRAIAGELGYTVVAVPVTKALHLKSSVTALPDGTVIGHPTLVDHPELFERYLEVPEIEGVAVLVLSPSAVLISASAPKTAALIADLGYRVVTVDIGEFEKLEGCVTCLSVRIR